MRTLLTILLVAGLAIGGYFASSRSGSNSATKAGGSAASTSVAGASSSSFSSTNSTGSTNYAKSDGLVSDTIRCQGTLKPASGLINIVAPVGSRIASLVDVPVGGSVKKGDVLVTLQSREIREQDLKLAKARRADALSKAEFESDQARYKLSSAKLAVDEAKGSDEKIAASKQKIKLLSRQLIAGQSLLGRLNSLRNNPSTHDLLNQTDLDKQRLIVEQLQMQIEQSNLEIELARKSAGRAQQAAENNVYTIESSLKNANKAVPMTTLDATVEMAQLALDMTEIKSPIDNATVLDIIVREGDSVTNKPVMIIGDTTEMHCVAEVSDQFLHLIDVGQNKTLKATIKASALPKSLTGTVVSKGVMIGAASLSDPNPFGKVDRRTGNVTIKLDDADAAKTLVNLQVDVEIRINND